MDQIFINWALTGLAALLGWLLNQLWQAVKDLQSADDTLATKISDIEVLVAGQYVKRDDFDRTATAIFAKLDKIYDRLDQKADR